MFKNLQEGLNNNPPFFKNNLLLCLGEARLYIKEWTESERKLSAPKDY